MPDNNKRAVILKIRDTREDKTNKNKLEMIIMVDLYDWCACI